MQQECRSTVRESLVAGTLSILGLYALASAVAFDGALRIQFRELSLAIALIAAIILADRHPIHILRGTKLSLINLPIFLAAVLLPATLAIVVTGTGLLVASLLARVERGLLPSDIASTVGQWMFTSFLGYQIVHLELPPAVAEYVTRYSLLLLCAITFLLADFLIFSLSQSFVFQEPFRSTLQSVIKEGIVLEAVQYLIAILGALAASTDVWTLILLIVPLSITYIAFKNIKETRYETIQVLEDMADTVDLRDVYTGGHSQRVAGLVQEVLSQLKISGPEVTLITIAARLHDIGKIGIPDSILKKPGNLSTAEMDSMKTHPQKGAELISKYRDFLRGAEIIRCHHERWDGKGYPGGLREHQIPFGARIIAVVDSYDAMISDRPYRKALSANQAIHVLLEGRGTQWDPGIVNTFVELISEQATEDKWEINPISESEDAAFPARRILSTTE